MTEFNQPKPCSACGDPRHDHQNPYCKPCRAAYLRARRHLGLDKNYASRVLTPVVRHDRKTKALEITSKSCQECGWTPKDPSQYAVLHFHHRNEDKAFSLSSMYARSWDEVVKELAKCDVLCSNCHILAHVKRPAKKTSGRPKKPSDERFEYFLRELGPRWQTKAAYEEKFPYPADRRGKTIDSSPGTGTEVPPPVSE